MQSNKLEDQVFGIKAKAHDDYKIDTKFFGNIIMKTMILKEDEDEEYDRSSRRKKGNLLNIKKSLN